MNQYVKTTKNYRFYSASEINTWRNSDPVLLKIVGRANVKQRFWAAVGMTYSSNIFNKVLRLIQNKMLLDRIPFSERFARDARDRSELLHSVGMLIVMARSDLPIHIRMANLEALAAAHPQALVTMHRHSLFRSLLADINAVRKAKDDNESERLKQQFAILFQDIDAAAKHPDASRLLNLQYEQPQVQKAYNLLINALVISVAIVNVMDPKLAETYRQSIHSTLPITVRKLIDAADKPVRGVMENNSELKYPDEDQATP
jgi:hypothetical protein